MLVVLAITTQCRVSIAGPVSEPSSSTPQTTRVDLLMPSVRPQVVRHEYTLCSFFVAKNLIFASKPFALKDIRNLKCQ